MAREEPAAVDIVAPVPWGRTLAEYRAMFALRSPEDGCRILDVAAGPASFAAEWTAGGGRAVACDPLYAGSGPEIAARLAAARDAVREVLAAHPGRFTWRSFADPEALVAERRRAAERFLADLAPGRTAGRYLAGTLPRLPFADRAFDLALCSHFLFLYSAAFDAAFHLAALVELARVAAEVRVFPLLAMAGQPSPHLPAVLDGLGRAGLEVAVVPVDYEVLRGGDRMLRLRRPPLPGGPGSRPGPARSGP